MDATAPSSPQGHPNPVVFFDISLGGKYQFMPSILRFIEFWPLFPPTHKITTIGNNPNEHAK